VNLLRQRSASANWASVSFARRPEGNDALNNDVRAEELPQLLDRYSACKPAQRAAVLESERHGSRAHRQRIKDATNARHAARRRFIAQFANGNQSRLAQRDRRPPGALHGKTHRARREQPTGSGEHLEHAGVEPLAVATTGSCVVGSVEKQIQRGRVRVGARQKQRRLRERIGRGVNETLNRKPQVK
jgi:hypothetical protein